MPTIKDLRKGDRFQFNNDSYQVTRHWMTENIPLIAIKERGFREMNKFHHEGLEIKKLQRLNEFSLSDLLIHLKYTGYRFCLDSNESGYILSIIPNASKIYNSFYGNTIDQLIKEVIENPIVNQCIKPL